MLNVTNGFKQAIQTPIKDVKGYLELADGTLITQDDDLLSFDIHATGELLKPSMKQIDIELKENHLDLRGKTIKVFYGVYHDGDYEYQQLGVFNILEADLGKDDDTTKLKGYDNMVLFMKPYQPVSDFPTTLAPFLQSLSASVGVTLATEGLYNDTLSMPEDYWATIPEATYRDVLKEICEVSVSNARINAEGELEIIAINHDTGESLTYENLIEYDVKESWGKVNSLVLSRQPQNDDVYLQDEESINASTTRNILDLNKFNVRYSSEEA